MKKLVSHIVILVCTALLSACGGASQTAPTASVIKTVIKPTALTAGLNIGGVQMAIALPRGVTPPVNLDGSFDTTSVIEFISAAPSEYKVQKATYKPLDSVLEFSVIDLVGFNTEDLIIIHLIVSPGTIPQPSDFSIKTAVFYDKTSGESIKGLNPTLTTTIQ